MGDVPPAARRRRRYFAALGAVVLVLAVLLSCRARARAGLTEHQLEHEGRERSFLVHLPPGHSPTLAVPLVIALHGGGGVAAYFNSFTKFSLTREADARGWVLLFPQGVAKGWNDGRPSVDRASRERAGVDDVGYISTLIDHAHAKWGVDRERVFVTGISNGGAMSFRLAVDLSERIRAVAPVTMGLPVGLEHTAPKRPLSVLLVNGTEDPLVPFRGGQIRVLGKERGEVLSTDATLELFAKHAACTRRSGPRTLPDLDPDDGTRVSFEAREGCADGTTVALYRIEGGGHTWPGGRQYLPERTVGRVSRELDASKAIFDFFAEHAK
ncbi:MAG: esterase [Myxococcales bacterium]|nr:esterase [Myxococcales bacterium]